MRAVIPHAALLQGGWAATHLGDFDGLLTQAAVASASAVLPYQTAAGIICGPPLLHGKPSCPFLLVLRSRHKQLAPACGTLHTPQPHHSSQRCQSPGAGNVALLPSLPAPQLLPMCGETWDATLPTIRNGSR